jgi:hypothetical protein
MILMDTPRSSARSLRTGKPLVGAKAATTAPTDHPLLAVKAALYGQVVDVSAAIANDRTPEDVLVHLLSEYGELAEEVSIATGRSHKTTPGTDGVGGEAIDVVLCAVDALAILSSALGAGPSIGVVPVVEPAQPPRSGRRPTTTSLTLCLLTPIGMLEHAIGQPRRTKAQRDSAFRLAALGVSRIVDACLRIVALEHPGHTAEDVLTMSARKCAKWRAAAQRTGGL